MLSESGEVFWRVSKKLLAACSRFEAAGVAGCEAVEYETAGGVEDNITGAAAVVEEVDGIAVPAGEGGEGGDEGAGVADGTTSAGALVCEDGSEGFFAGDVEATASSEEFDLEDEDFLFLDSL